MIFKKECTVVVNLTTIIHALYSWDVFQQVVAAHVPCISITARKGLPPPSATETRHIAAPWPFVPLDQLMQNLWPTVSNCELRAPATFCCSATFRGFSFLSINFRIASLSMLLHPIWLGSKSNKKVISNIPLLVRTDGPPIVVATRLGPTPVDLRHNPNISKCGAVPRHSRYR